MEFPWLVSYWRNKTGMGNWSFRKNIILLQYLRSVEIDCLEIILVSTTFVCLGNL
ncbi:hypothetical protein YC2023_078747 [Brassica napus]